jgi:UDP-N-acetylmuramoylalanine--D-glutamate ligase
MRSPDPKTSRLGIWGFGTEGRAALTALSSSYARVTVFDEHPFTPDPIEGVDFYWGTDHIHELLSCDLVVVSPGVPSTHPFLAELTSKHVNITSSSALWLELNAQRTIGVTGTKGKSTTSALIHNILTHAPIDATLAGNIGIPLIGVQPDESLVVAELSSYQCWWITRSPRVAVITNLFEEHLPWHGSLRNYWQAKARIATHGAEFLICDEPTWEKLNFADKAVRQLSPLLIQESGPDILARDGKPVLILAELPPSLQPRHLISSIRAAVLAASVFLDTPTLCTVLKSALHEFHQLPHRLEVVATIGGVTWVDDTLSTTPQSVIAAAESVHPNHTVLIIGGQDRGISYAPLNDFLKSNPDTIDVIAIPTNGPEAVTPFRELCPHKVHDAPSLIDAVALAAKIAPPGSHVILSPGAPSFDFYDNYQAKSADFRAAITQLPNS